VPTHSPGIELQPVICEQRARGDVQPDVIRVHVLAHPDDGLYESRADLRPEQATGLQHRGDNLARVQVLQAESNQ
jgi:hypothetical protein